MRIYNATNSQISLPFPGGRLDIPAHSISGNVGANTEVITLLVSAYSADEIAFVVSGPFELNLCSSIPTVPMYVVQSLEEALAKFHVETTKDSAKMDGKAKKAVHEELPVEEEVKTAPVVEEVVDGDDDCECEECENCEEECESCECEDEVLCGDYSKKEEEKPEESTKDEVEVIPMEEPEPDPVEEEKVETREEKRERVFGHRPNNFNRKKHNN